MSLFQPGQLVYHDYGEIPRVVHTRLILGHITGHDYWIRTPDGDEYVETCHDSNQDLTAFYVGADDGSLPLGAPAGVVYGFQPMSFAELNAILIAGRVAAAAERARLGIPDVAAASPGAGQLGQTVWVIAEHVAGHKIGEQVMPPAGHAMDGSYGLMRVQDSNGDTRPVLIHQIQVADIPEFCERRVSMARSTEALEGNDKHAGEDVRTLEVKYNLSGERYRPFKEAISEMQQCEFDDYPLEPRTALSYLRAVAGVAESCFSQHLAWVAQSKIPEGDRSIHENEVLSRALDLAVTYDALNISNLASFELLIRRKQLIADTHSYSPGAPSYEAAEHYLGNTYKPGGAIVVPELTKHVADKMHQESQILKERRKQQELKGKGRGKPFNPPKADPKAGQGGAGK